MKNLPAFLLPFLLFAGPVLASDEQPLRRTADSKGVLTFTLENDLFAGHDDGYTNGVRLSYFSPENNMPAWVDNALDTFGLLSNPGRRRWQVKMGQSMFAPDDLTISTLQTDDRPYAGWLYLSGGVVADTGKRLDSLEITIGMVGPASGAAETQRLVHEIVNSPIPQGWGHQLHNEPGLVISYERKWRNLVELTPFGLGVDLTPSVGASAGNIYTHAAAGLMARVGYDLPVDYGPPLIGPNLSGSDFFVPVKGWGWYLFAGVEGRAVARNIFLDGNTFRNSPSVDKETFVGGAQVGAAITNGNMRMAYTHIFRTREFEGQKNPDAFGALTLSVRF